MPTMYRDGSDPIDVQKGQIHNAEVRGWSLEKLTKKEKTIKSKRSK
jgi:hypothetical protein